MVNKKSTSNKDKIATTAHLIETTGHHLSHTSRHVDQLAKSKTKAQRNFNLEHIKTHLDGGIEHVQKLMKHMQSNYPAEGKELGKLQDTVARSDIGQKVKAAHQANKRKK